MGWSVASLVLLASFLTCPGHSLLQSSLTRQVLAVTTYCMQVSTLNLLIMESRGCSAGDSELRYGYEDVTSTLQYDQREEPQLHYYISQADQHNQHLQHSNQRETLLQQVQDNQRLQSHSTEPLQKGSHEDCEQPQQQKSLSSQEIIQPREKQTCKQPIHQQQHHHQKHHHSPHREHHHHHHHHRNLQQGHRMQPHHHHHHHHHHRQQGHHTQHRQQQRAQRIRRLQKRHQLFEHNPLHRHDRRPRRLHFSQSEYRQTVSEDIPPHTSVLTVRATDGLPGGHRNVRYQLSDSTNFAINEGGVIYNLRRLDFERTDGHYVLQVTAEDEEDGRWGRNKAVVTANVQVTDAPEEPYFENSHYSFSVSEFAPKGSYVGKVRAQDDDGDLDYYFLDGVEPPDMFTINSVTGVLSLDRAPDGTQWLYTFHAGALDHRGHDTLVPVTVHIIASSPSFARLVWVANDDNDHKPVFPDCEAYDEIHVNENVTAGTPVLLVLATDKDSGQNGAVTYSLINDFESFAIHASNHHGQITTTRRLDRDGEDKDFFLTVIAKDGALEPLQVTCSFRVIVDDINDNPPMFDQPRYEQTLATDHSPATPVLRVTASDLDSGANARVTYHLEGHPDHLAYFSLEPITGVMSLQRPLARALAITKTFEMRIRAVDSGTPPLWSTAPVTIHVVSSGELPPSVVSQKPRHPAIPENTTENTEVVTLCARSNLQDSSNVYFTLRNGNTRDTNADGTFAIRRLPDESGVCRDSTSVSIFVATRNLDYESVQAYRLNLQIVNDRNARLERQVVVNILDVNDNAPLLQPFDGAVLENTDSTLITTIQAVDKDASPQFRELTYSFDATASDDVISKFTLKTNGELWTTRPLDREEVRQYRVPIQVTDGVPEHERMTIYWITVQDLNDVAPVFDRKLGVYEVQLPENREVGKPTGIRLVVDDPDIMNDNTYQIVEGNEERKFRIDASTGDVLVNKALDFDHPMFDRNFTMRVRLDDGNNEPAEIDITIAVVNVNDLQPVFEQANYSFTVTENTDCSLVLGKVSALDPDLPPSANQNILYYLSPAELRNFSIGDRSGQLSMKGCLDREAATRGTMTLYPRANDEGGKGHDADPATVQVTIIDLNDNYPHFIQPAESYARIPENLEPKTVDPVIIELGDLDSEENGCPCSLEFAAATPDFIREKFTLTPIGGSRYRLEPVAVLDREEQKVYRLPFTARDSQGLAGVRYLTLEVGDVNDSPMTDGFSAIRVYNYQGQFPAMVIGAVHVSDEDDYDRRDKNFEVDATTTSEVTSHFKVDHYTGDITMLKGTPAGAHVLRVKVQDNFRREVAIGETTITVVDLTLEAVMQSGSLRLSNITAQEMLQQQQSGASGTSLYERLKKQIARIHIIPESQVDVFAVKDVEGSGVDVRYNCHGSPYYTAARLDGVMLRRRQQVSETLGVDITLVDINACLYEGSSPCGSNSCQHTMRPNLTSPLVVSSDTVTIVGVDITDDYACDCGALEPLPSVCFSGFCYNGGTCSITNNTLTCNCLDGSNYGPRCELLTARFERGFAWYEPLTVCEHSYLSLTFETKDESGVLLYMGPTVPTPWPGYPRDFLYVVLHGWVVETYLDLGTGTINITIPIEPNMDRAFEYVILWNKNGVTAEVVDCGINVTLENLEPCKKALPLPRLTSSPSHLLNVQGPLQIGGVAAMVSFPQLAASYSWSLTPPAIYPFSGCILQLRHNDHLYDLNATDFSKQTFQPCDAPRTSRVVLGQQSIIIILASLLCLFLLVVVILCLARHGKKSVSYPDLDRELVKETMGGTDLEGFGEKDVTHFDLKFLQVTPDGYLISDDNEAGLPDVAQDACQRRSAPLAEVQEGLSIGDFIKENKLKVDQEHQDVDDVRHYNLQGDEMSAASLSSLASGSSRSEFLFDYKNDWGQRFEKLAQIYRAESDAEEDSEYEFPDIPSNLRKHVSYPDSTKANENDESEMSSAQKTRHIDHSQSPSATDRATGGSSAPDSKLNSGDSPVPVLVSRDKSQSPVASPVSKTKSISPASSINMKNAKPPSSPPANKHSVDPKSSPLITKHKVVDPLSCHLATKQNGDPLLSHLTSKQKVNQPPSPNIKRKLEPPSSPIRSRYSIDTPVTTINNLYKSPAQRSLATSRTNSLPRSSLQTPRGATTNSTNTLGSRRSPDSKVGSGRTTLKKKEYHETVNPMAAVQAVKGIETWC